MFPFESVLCLYLKILFSLQRDLDGANIISKEAFDKQMDVRKNMFVFTMPRLIRDKEGRPVGVRFYYITEFICILNWFQA